MDLDLLIHGGTVVDGTGAPAYRADVGVKGGRIVALGDLAEAAAASRIDATDRAVSPGFIDAHIHSETALRGNKDQLGSSYQGVTTHLTSPDGFGWAPLPPIDAQQLWRGTSFAEGNPGFRPAWHTVEEYLAGFEGSVPVNVVPVAPHQAIRFAVLGWDPKEPDAAELERMRDVLRQWLDAGAVGLNTGLDYPPAAHSTTRELIELAKVVAQHGGVYASHMRYQGLGRPDALREAAEIGRSAGVPVNVSHETIDDDTEPIHAEARADVDFAFDWYVYPAGSSTLLVNMPPEDQVGGIDGVMARLRDPATRARFARLAEEYLVAAYASGAREYFSDTTSGDHIGRSIREIAEQRGRPLGETAIDLLEEEAPDVLLVFKRGMSDEQFEALARRTITQPGYTVASDGIYHGVLPHPRGYGTFTRFLRLWVREKGVLSLEDAIRRMTGGVADRYGIKDRGRVAEGLAADLVVFDPATVSDHATWEQPRERPTGVDAVLVNGRVVIQGGRPTGELPGRVVRRGDR